MYRTYMHSKHMYFRNVILIEVTTVNVSVYIPCMFIRDIESCCVYIILKRNGVKTGVSGSK